MQDKENLKLPSTAPLVLAQILTVAQNASPKPTLLHVLDAMEKVIERRKEDPSGNFAISIYRTLLCWDRDKTHNFREHMELLFPNQPIQRQPLQPYPVSYAPNIFSISKNSLSESSLFRGTPTLGFSESIEDSKPHDYGQKKAQLSRNDEALLCILEEPEHPVQKIVKKEGGVFQEHKMSFGLQNSRNAVATARTLPRLNFEDVVTLQNSSRIQEMRQETSYERNNGEHAIDSNAMLAIAYHTRRLILRGFNALLYSRVYHIHKRFLTQVAASHLHKTLHKKYFTKLKKNKVIRRKKRMLNLIRDTLKARQTQNYFKFWLAAARRQRAENTIITNFQRGYRQMVLFRVWSQWGELARKGSIERQKFKEVSRNLKLWKKKRYLAKFRKILAIMKKKRLRGSKATQYRRIGLLARYMNRLYMGTIRYKEQKQKIQKAHEEFKKVKQLKQQRGSLGFWRQISKAKQYWRKVLLQAEMMHCISLQYRCLNKLQRFGQISRTKKQQRQSVEMFWGKRMALKVLICLRNYGVQRKDSRERVDQYYLFQLQKKTFTRLAFYYKKHHLTHPATNGLLIHASMRWLSQVFPSVSTTRDTHRSGSKCQILSELNSLKYSSTSPRYYPQSVRSEDHQPQQNLLPAPLHISNRSHYSRFYETAQANYARFIMKRLFSQWRSYAANLVEFRNELLYRHLFQQFRGWHQVTQKLAATRGLLVARKKCRNRKTKRLVLDILTAYRKYKQKERAMVSSIQARCHLEQLRSRFTHWLTLKSKVAQQRQNQQNAGIFLIQRVWSFYFTVWRNRFAMRMKKFSLRERNSQFTRYRLLGGCFRLWRKNFKEESLLKFKLLQFDGYLAHKLLAKSYQSLLIYSTFKKEKIENANKAWLYLRRSRLSKTLYCWKKAVPLLKAQNTLITMVQNDRAMYLQRKSLAALRHYANYRQQKQKQDKLQTRAIRNVQRRNLFRKWKKRVFIQHGLFFLSSLLPALQVKFCFTAVINYLGRVRSLLKETDQKRKQRMQSRSLLSFKFVSQRRALEAETSDFIQLRSPYWIKKSTLSEWRAKRLQKIKMRYFFFKSVKQIKDSIVQPYFMALRKNYERKIRKRKAETVYPRTLRKYYYSVLKLHWMRCSHYREVSYLFRRTRERGVKDEFMNEWKRRTLCRELGRIKYTETANKYKREALGKWRKALREQLLLHRKILLFRKTKITRQLKEGLLKMWESKERKRQNLKLEEIARSQFLYFLSSRAFAGLVLGSLKLNKARRVHHAIKTKREKQQKRNVLLHWLHRTQPRFVRHRAMQVCLLKMAPQLIKRKALITWVYALLAERELDSYVERCSEEIQGNRLLRALQQWRTTIKEKAVWNQRMYNTQAYYEKKMVTKALQNWCELLPTLRLKREKKDMARLQHCLTVGKQALQKWKRYRQIKHNLKERITRLKEVLVLRHCYEPLVFLRTYALRKRASRVSHKSAMDMYISRMCVKSFRCLFLYALQKTAKRTLKTKARMHYFGKMGYKCLNQLYQYATAHRERNTKRRALKKAVMSVDRSILLRKYANMLSVFNENESKQLQEMSLQLTLKKERRLFQAWILHQRRKNSISSKRIGLQRQRELRIKGKILRLWFDNYDLNLREQRWRISAMRRVCSTVLKGLAKFTRSRMNCRVQITRTSSARRVKLLRHYFTALHDEWKVCRFRLYRKLKEKLELQRNGFNSLQIYKNKGLRQKALLQSILSHNQKKEESEALGLWKKTVRFVIFVETLRRHTSEARTLNYTHYALYFWQKYASGERLKGLRTDHIRMRWTMLTRREYFQEWFHRARPLIAANVIERNTRLRRIKKQKLKIFRKWSQWAGRKCVLGELGKVLGKHTSLLLVGRFMKVWRRAALDCSIVRTFLVKHERTLLKKSLFALYQNLNKKVAKSQEIASLRSALQLQEKVGSFMSRLPISQVKPDKSVYNKHWAIMMMLNTFRDVIDFKTEGSMKLYNLKKWRGMVGVLRYRRMQRNQAQQMMERSLRLKYWVQMRNKYIERKKEALLLITADRARVKLVLSRVWEAWTRATILCQKIRRIENARSYKIKGLIMKRMKFFKKRAMHINSLRERMMRYLKYSCGKLATKYYQKWRVAYVKEQDLLNRVAEYKRRERLTKLTLTMRYIGDWRLKKAHLREVGKKAQNYFRERDIRRMKKKVIYGWRAMHLETKTNVLEDQYLLQKAIAHRDYRLKSECLQIWMQNSTERQSRARRSQLYSIYSAWKFYTKEHKLLRKYLKESGTEELQFLRSTRREDALGAVMREVVSLDEGSCYSSLMANSDEGEGIGIVEGMQPSVLSGPARQQTTPHSQLRSAMGLSSDGGAIDFQITGSSIQAEGDLNFSSDLID